MVFLLMHVVPRDIALLILGTGEQGGDVNLTDLERAATKNWGSTARSMSSSSPGSGGSSDWISAPPPWSGAPVLEELWICLPLTLRSPSSRR